MAKATKKPRKLTAHVTYLEMKERHAVHAPMPSRPQLALMRAENMPVAYYRYLFEQVGRNHHWFLRRAMNDEELAGIIHSENTQIDVLYAGGCPAGYFELDLSALPERVEIAYFGLARDYVGMGLGKWFLAEAIETAWEKGPSRVTVHTNTLDHPAALQLYQRLGFEPVGVGEETVEAWD
ncbi:MAG: GNAT family N-acetyltransferase [Nitratireductor sp.]|nr:GNAT family N-acetyltransferase [Nitratireductor sp.]